MSTLSMVGAQNERLTADAVVNITYNPYIQQFTGMTADARYQVNT